MPAMILDNRVLARVALQVVGRSEPKMTQARTLANQVTLDTSTREAA